MERNIFYVISQKTNVNKRKFEENADPFFIEEITTNNDDPDKYTVHKQYYPFEKEQLTLMY